VKWEIRNLDYLDNPVYLSIESLFPAGINDPGTQCDASLIYNLLVCGLKNQKKIFAFDYSNNWEMVNFQYDVLSKIK
jgi:hypothetical protein